MALELMLITYAYMELNRDRDDLSLEERRRGDELLSDEKDAGEHTTSKDFDPPIPTVIHVRRKKRRTSGAMISTPASERTYNSHYQKTDKLIESVKVLTNNQREQMQMLQSTLAIATRYMEKSMKKSKTNKKRKRKNNQTSQSNLSIDSSDSDSD
eukprot:CAMPEP_0116080980 /NCGR_PEP_ID=MMETSP0327-20121206/1960_1 /TAXON_ID=44447 /ORGANISM="Pseudo-nitzschia delicatissima, Strain B596" /LENGTH=154 /DNA_ID=CAMNT_0003571699 /DNA_START=15 /DNA_END=479 /DNA_ORIENTATION=-